MKKNRDDFSASIKQKACDRVCSLCSICFTPTKGPSAESDGSVSNIGVAAHICAAAPGGPRYDTNMTNEERASIQNCIWLCQNHAKIIDSDIKTYTKEKLLEYKNIAENRAHIALIKGENFEEQYNNGLDIQQIYSILDKFIVNGEYLELKIFLDSMKTSELNAEFFDLYSYFEIIYKFYCDRDGIKEKIQNYMKKTNKIFIKNLIILFIQFFEKDLVELVYEYCTNPELKYICSCLLEGAILGKIFLPEKELANNQKSVSIKLNSYMHKMITNFAINNNCGLEVVNEEVPFYENEFYYEQKVLLYSIYQRAIKGLIVKKQKLQDFPEYTTFIQNLDKIKLLTQELQIEFWIKLLDLTNKLEDLSAFENLYMQCNDFIKQNIEIESLFLIHEIKKNIDLVDFADIRRVCEKLKDYRPVCEYFNVLSQNNINKANVIFNENLYLLNHYFGLLYMYIVISQQVNGDKFSVIAFLQKYNEQYADDPNYHILLAMYSFDNQETFKQELTWILNRKNILNEIQDINTMGFLLKVYTYAKKYEEVVGILKLTNVLILRLQIADILAISNKKEYILYSIEIYKETINQNKKIKNLNRCLAYCYCQLGDFTNAKKYIKSELEIKFYPEDLLSLLNLKIYTSEFTVDEYVLQAESMLNSQILYAVGYIYSKNHHEIEKAKKILLKSLLINEELKVLHSFMHMCLGTEKENKPQRVETEVTVTLKHDDYIQRISIHEDKFLIGFEVNNLAGCTHLKESSKKIENLLLREIGEKVVFNNLEYEIVDLTWNESVICGYAIARLIQNGRGIAIKGNTIEEFRQNLAEFLEKSKNDLDSIITMYNQSPLNLPITFFKQHLGKRYLETFSFLFYENKSKIKNVYASNIVDNIDGYILSMDAIIILAILDIDTNLIQEKNCFCSIMTKRILLDEIESLLHEYKNKNYKDNIFSHDKQLYGENIDKERRRNTINYLNRIKRLLNILAVPEKNFFYQGNLELEKCFLDHNILLENDMLGFLQSKEKYLFVNDSVFLTHICIVEKLNFIGMNAFLNELDISVEKHIESIKQLARMNFGNYLTQDVYQKLKERIMSEENINQREIYLKEFFDLLTSKFIDKEQNLELWQYNHRITEEIIKANRITPETKDKFDYIVIDAFVQNVAKEKPEQFQELVKDIASRLKLELIQSDNQWELHSSLLPKNENK